MHGAHPARDAAVKHPGSPATRPVTLLRLALLDILVAIVRESGPAALRSVPRSFWTQVTAWFFDAFPESSAFHRAFFNLAATTLRAGDDDATDALLATRAPARERPPPSATFRVFPTLEARISVSLGLDSGAFLGTSESSLHEFSRFGHHNCSHRLVQSHVEVKLKGFRGHRR